MKKAIGLLMLFFCLALYSYAQIDSNRRSNDTNTLGQNKVYNNKRNHDSINNRMNRDTIQNKKKMPPKKSNGTSMINENNLLDPRKKIIA